MAQSMKNLGGGGQEGQKVSGRGAVEQVLVRITHATDGLGAALAVLQLQRLQHTKHVQRQLADFELHRDAMLGVRAASFRPPLYVI